MSNINFDNPFLLLIGIPLLLIAIIPFVISVKKDNRSVNNVISFVIHIVISIIITLAMAKTTYELVITETNIYVLADVSYSSNGNLNLIDEYISDLEEKSPKNSKIGVVCFGGDYELLVEVGEELRSVSEANIDSSKTDIYSALEYTATLFKDNVINRVVLISDGKETKTSNIASLVSELSSDNVYIDAIYLDNNLKEDANEVQINQIEYVKDTYLNTENKVIALVQSSLALRSYVRLYCDNELYSEKAIMLNKGFNSITFDLNTKDAGVHNYYIEVECDLDTSPYNNKYSFSQNVNEKMNMLFASNEELDKEIAKNLYGDSCNIDFYINDPDVPYTIEDLCKYDEFVLSNLDIRTIRNYTQFINSVDILVSEFSKSLITLGNTYIQNNEDDETLTGLSNMLPTKFGNNENEEKLVTLVIDISRSMEQLGKFIMAKETCCQIIDNLEEDTLVMVIAFFGEVGTVFEPSDDLTREELKTKIKNLEAGQGTFMGSALKYTYQFITDLPYSKNEVILISDGLPYGEQEAPAKHYVSSLRENNVIVSTIHTVEANGEALMRELAQLGGGHYYFISDIDDAEKLILDEVLNNLTEVVLEANESEVIIDLKHNELVSNIDSLPNVKGLYNNNEKTNADVILSARYTDYANNKFIVPLYVTWDYGNGRVSSFASSISGGWLDYWKVDESASKILNNILNVNMPEERISSAFIIDTEQSGTTTKITVNAPNLNNDSILNLKVTYPSLETEVISLAFDSENYITSIETDMVGKYIFEVYYSLGELNYSSTLEYNVSYLPEYNSFEVFEASNLYYMVSMNGEISEDGNLKLENDNSIVQKYIFDFTPVFMIISIALFVLDIMIRKLRLEDLKSILRTFNKKDKLFKEGGNNNEK